jgi:hypothetical protein
MTTLGRIPSIAHPAPLRAPARIVTAAPSSEPAWFESEMRMIPGVHVGLRSFYTEVRGHGVLVSPVGTSEEEMVVTQRPVALVAPSLLHHLHLRHAIERYQPDALWGPPGLAAKCPDLGGVHVFGRDRWPFAPELDFALIEGAPLRNEIVLFHAPSRTIYTADLVFNVHAPHGLLTPLAFRAMGIYKRFAVSRMWRSWVKDKPAFLRSIDRVLAWDFDRIVMAHGEVVEHEGPAKLVRALRDVGLYA